MARGDLTDAEWERLSPLLPTNYRLQRKKLRRKPGRAWKDHRQVFNGILWVLRTGAPWADLPERYGPHQTCWDRFARWQRDGTWQRLWAALQTEAQEQGALEWQDCSVDGSYVRAHQQATGARRHREAPTGPEPPGGDQPAPRTWSQRARRRPESRSGGVGGERPPSSTCPARGEAAPWPSG